MRRDYFGNLLPSNPFYRHKNLNKFKNKLSEWEFKFVSSIFNIKNLSQKQEEIANKIHHKFYINSNIKRSISNFHDVEQMIRNMRR